MTARPRGTFHTIDAIGLGALALLSAVPLWLSVLPRMRQAAENNRARAQLAASSVELTRRMKELEDLTASVQQRRDLRDRLERGFDQHRSINELNNELPEVASATGVTLSAIIPGTTTFDGPISNTPITLQGVGTFPRVLLLVESIERRFPDLHLIGFNIAGDGASPDTTWKLDFNRIAVTDAPTRTGK